VYNIIKNSRCMALVTSCLWSLVRFPRRRFLVPV
jgi:hypothetical protein